MGKGCSSASKMLKRQSKHISIRIIKRKGWFSGEARVGGNLKPIIGRGSWLKFSILSLVPT